MKKPSLHQLRVAFQMIVVITVIVNFMTLLIAYQIAPAHRRTTITLEPGTEFKDFKNIIAGEKTVGFLTDKDMSPEQNDGQFLGAQYLFAPHILDLNNPNHHLLILDYIDYPAALKKIKEIGAVYIYTNVWGKILAKRNP